MQSTFGSCPEIKNLEFDIMDYDEIILGIPVWAWKPSAPVWSFIKKYKVNDKIVGVFTSSADGKNDTCMKY